MSQHQRRRRCARSTAPRWQGTSWTACACCRPASASPACRCALRLVVAGRRRSEHATGVRSSMPADRHRSTRTRRACRSRFLAGGGDCAAHLQAHAGRLGEVGVRPLCLPRACACAGHTCGCLLCFSSALSPVWRLPALQPDQRGRRGIAAACGPVLAALFKPVYGGAGEQRPGPGSRPSLRRMLLGTSTINPHALLFLCLAHRRGRRGSTSSLRRRPDRRWSSS